MLSVLVPDSAGDRTISVSCQLGSSDITPAVPVVSSLTQIENAVQTVLNSVPGWHLSANVTKAPSYSANVTGAVVVSGTGAVESGTLSVTGNAAVGATIEGYYGYSVLNVGVGVNADLDAGLTGTVTYTPPRRIGPTAARSMSPAMPRPLPKPPSGPSRAKSMCRATSRPTRPLARAVRARRPLRWPAAWAPTLRPSGRRWPACRSRWDRLPTLPILTSARCSSRRSAA